MGLKVGDHVGNLVLGESVGKGAYGVVRKAMDMNSGQFYACKSVRSASFRRAERGVKCGPD